MHLPPAFPATAEQVAASPRPGECVRIVRRSVSFMEDLEPQYFVTWEYEVIPTPERRERRRSRWLRWRR